MMVYKFTFVSLLLATLLTTTRALPYLEDEVEFNLNQNETATDPINYWGEWEDHDYTPSPSNWRFPFYTIFLDRFANGDPSNDDANNTVYEHDFLSNQFRNGGDITGLLNKLDYLQGMGIKGLYLAGSPFINQPWGVDGYSPLDFTLLDYHFGNITAWRTAITEIHNRGMYVILDNTMATMGDLLGFDGYLNTTAPFEFGEHDTIYKTSRKYWDFDLDNGVEYDCNYPKYWDADGDRVGYNVTSQMVSCRKSDFDQYGDVESFGTYPEYQKQLSKFGFVQDRLRDWRPSVLDKIKRFSCITVSMLDIDGFRIDKGLTTTLDSQASWSSYMRECAKSLGKDNFYIPGELVSANPEASLYLGRGKEPHMALSDYSSAYSTTNATDDSMYLRNISLSALDAAAFHYSTYRSLCRFLSLDGVYAALEDLAVDFAESWQGMLETNDFINSNTGEFDPRHLYGITNQDVFRWPAITNGTHRNLLGMYVISLIMPGSPMLMWGEEQAFYVLDNTADNYIYGRSPMSSALAWQSHGCYTVGSSKYANFPLDAALYGCLDDDVSLDHFDPSHPIRNVIRRFFELREEYPVLNDGFVLEEISKDTWDRYQPGSEGTPTETGIWSVMRSAASNQDLSNSGGQGNQTVWLVYGNENHTVDYSWDCTSAGLYNNFGLTTPFDSGTTIRNLFYPYEEYTVSDASNTTGGFTTCLTGITMEAWDFKAFVPVDSWVEAKPVITGFTPGHDYRQVTGSETDTIDISISFSQLMDCDSVTDSISITSNTADGTVPNIDSSTITCNNTDAEAEYRGEAPTAWTWYATLENVKNGIHELTVTNATNQSKNSTTNSADHLLFRVGKSTNPMIFPHSANYSSELLQKNSDGSYYISHNAPGASKFRFSLDFESSWSSWYTYDSSNFTLPSKNWTGTSMQAWSGEHVLVQYWSDLAQSSNHYQHGDYGRSTPRQWPHMYVQGSFNQYSYDTGLPGTMSQTDNGTWYFDFMYEWPTSFQLNKWGINPNGEPDQSLILGDIDGDSVLDRLPPGSLIADVINITDVPPSPYVAWRIHARDADNTYWVSPVGSRWLQLLLFVLLWLVPIATAGAVIWVFMKSFYHVKFNQVGVLPGGNSRQALIPLAVRRKLKKAMMSEKGLVSTVDSRSPEPEPNALAADAGGHRRSVLIATMEYDIEDWAIKIKIGGLGVMAQLMGKNLGHQDLIWVVPCVQGVDYPIDQPAESMFITILDKEYEIQVQYHVLRNITYVLLDAPIFRKQSKSEPYPARMDDLESAIYYSAWNQCIAQACTRFDVSLYHINDYHGALAPLHLLPKVIPCALSLHNAEFQGLWPMRTQKEREEVCKVFNLDPVIAQKYVQFGEVFNLLHAGASYLRIHQKGFGAVGVSKKYGKRTFARYPIFWGLSKIGSLPNPDPSDTAEWERDNQPDSNNVSIDTDMEARRPELKRQAQEWAGLDQNPDAELFVFVGRWSMQKGVDLIADVFPSILEAYPKVQLITVGPIIDLYGRFAALKLEKMMQLYPGRVYSKPEFTALPPYIFSGSEFALIPSRDEPFGLVAVEFGRKGALGVGARVGGLGQMPGWWYNIESMTPKHLVHQFKMAIHEALASSQKTRALMRARSALQRFPVAQWVEDLDTLQGTAIRISREENTSEKLFKSPSMANLRTLFTGPSTTSLSEFPMPNSRHGSTLMPPGTPGTPGAGPWTPTISVPSPGLSPYSPNSPLVDDILLPPPITPAAQRESMSSRRFSTLSYDSVTQERTDFALQKVDPAFTDAQGIYLREFEKKLEHLGAKSSENLLCIEENLMKSEKKYFNSYRDAKMGISTSNSRAGSIINISRPSTPRPGTPQGSFFEHSAHGSVDSMPNENLLNEEFPLGADYRPPTGIARWLLYRVGDWPIYSIILSFGQIIAANSYQITLLIGEVGETALQLYIIATIYAVGSVCWWLVYRRFKAVVVLSVPFVFYGIAFLLIGLAPLASGNTRGWIQNIATGVYAVASSSGALFFALNFGDEGGAPVKAWVLRACLVQGTQQIYISALWYWGASLTKLSSTGTVVTSSIIPNAVIMGLCIPLCAFLWALGAMLFVGLPSYYRSAPGKVPSFYRSVFRRKIIIWFFITVLIQNYFLSAPYGRNWRYLWTTNHAPAWAIFLLVLLFFVGVWILILWIFWRLTSSHSWILPVFAIGLGAPRWCQMLWGTSAVGEYLPWAGSAVASALLGRCLWLWLGVLDAVQGVGFGMILLQTMTRFHISFTLISAQVLGSIATILARLTAPDKTGPGSVFPNFALGGDGLASAGFWLALVFQIIVCVGFALFFRKEQLSKP